MTGDLNTGEVSQSEIVPISKICKNAQKKCSRSSDCRCPVRYLSAFIFGRLDDFMIFPTTALETYYLSAFMSLLTKCHT